MIPFSEDGELLPLDFSTYSSSKPDENKSRYLRVRGFYTDMLSRDPQEFGGTEAESLPNKETDCFARVTFVHKSPAQLPAKTREKIILLRKPTAETGCASSSLNSCIPP